MHFLQCSNAPKELNKKLEHKNTLPTGQQQELCGPRRNNFEDQFISQTNTLKHNWVIP